MIVTGINAAIAEIKRRGWDQMTDANHETMLVGDLEDGGEDSTDEYAIDEDAIVLMRDGFRAETVFTRTA